MRFCHEHRFFSRHLLDVQQYYWIAFDVANPQRSSRASGRQVGLPGLLSNRKVAEIDTLPHVVVVDDSPEFLSLLRDLISDSAVVDCLDAPDTTVDDIALLMPDVVILDLKLAGGPDGWDLIRACRDDRRLAERPVLICSADSFGIAEHQAEIDAMSNVAVLNKPFDIAEFDAVLGTLLRTPV